MTADFGSLSRFGGATALVEESGAEISYAALARRCEAFAGALGDDRQLVLLQAANDTDAVVAYLAAGHVAILTGDTDTGSESRIVQAFSPSVICKRGRITRIANVSTLGKAIRAQRPDEASGLVHHARRPWRLGSPLSTAW